MNYRNTDIYQLSLQLVAATKQTVEALPRGYGYLADQMRRAAASIALNFAEGCGKAGRAEQRRFYRIARGSSYELAGAFDVAHALGLVEPKQHLQLVDRCDHLAAMLTRFGAR